MAPTNRQQQHQQQTTNHRQHHQHQHHHQYDRSNTTNNTNNNANNSTTIMTSSSSRINNGRTRSESSSSLSLSSIVRLLLVFIWLVIMGVYIITSTLLLNHDYEEELLPISSTVYSSRSNEWHDNDTSNIHKKNNSHKNTPTKQQQRPQQKKQQPITVHHKNNNNNHNHHHPPVIDRTSIRRWGCSRNETPFIFVHIGKSGGGEARRMFAAAALNYTAPPTKQQQWQQQQQHPKEKYTKQKKIDFFTDETAYYTIPLQSYTIPNDGSTSTIPIFAKARFASSLHKNFRPFAAFDRRGSMEGNRHCDAETPIGQAMMCPAEDRSQCPKMEGEDGTAMDVSTSLASSAATSASCHLVYVGHNMIGNEMHWLPKEYLAKWWNETIVTAATTANRYTGNTSSNSSNSNSKSTEPIPSWEELPSWSNCGPYDQTQKVERTPTTKRCQTQFRNKVDSIATRSIYSLVARNSNTHTTHTGEEKEEEDTTPNHQQLHKNKHYKQQTEPNPSSSNSWSTIYASLPVLRVTMTREPFSWLASKYLWHSVYTMNLTYDNIEQMTYRRPQLSSLSSFSSSTTNTTTTTTNNNEVDSFRRSFLNHTGPGWANHYALEQIITFCGEDCLVRYLHGTATLTDIEQQAEENIRHSFAVVGLLTEPQSFYDMVAARVGYMGNITNNAHLVTGGGRHRTRLAGGSLSRDVKRVYADRGFQRRLVDASPEIASLVRLYEVSVEVNRFQMEELRSCPSLDPLLG